MVIHHLKYYLKVFSDDRCIFDTIKKKKVNFADI